MAALGEELFAGENLPPLSRRRQVRRFEHYSNTAVGVSRSRFRRVDFSSRKIHLENCSRRLQLLWFALRSNTPNRACSVTRLYRSLTPRLVTRLNRRQDRKAERNITYIFQQDNPQQFANCQYALNGGRAGLACKDSTKRPAITLEFSPFEPLEYVLRESSLFLTWNSPIDNI